MQLFYQPGSIGVASAVMLASWTVRWLSGVSVVPLRFVSIGDLQTGVNGLSLLAAPGESWRDFGIRFALIATALTALVIWLQSRPRPRPELLLAALPLSTVFSVINAAVEETIFRIAVLQSLVATIAPSEAAIVSGVMFGVPHYFGRPGGLPGVIMAGFLGWMMATATLQTGGIGWAWVMHFVQDVVIITIMIAAAASAKSVQPEGGLT
jgi:membrane protease YdiL (CAAX protease family)